MRLFLLFVFCATSVVGAEHWPAWRGPNHNGVSTATDLATQWGPDQNIAWRVALPGPAPSTPVVWGDHIFLTSSDKNGALLLLAFDTQGKPRWQAVLGSGNKDIRQGESNAAASSPATDGKHVWAFVATGALACFDMDGNEQWRLDVQKTYGVFKMYWGMATTPLVDKNTLYLALIHDNAQLVVALDKTTGQERWTHKRQTDARSENLHSYASPVIYRHDGLEQLLVHGADYITAHSLQDGAEIWRCGGLQKEQYNPYLRFVASPVTAPGLIVVPSAKNGPVLGLNPIGARGDITHNKSAYHWKRNSNTPDVPSPVIHDGLVYLCRENGVLICLDAKTGKEIYMERTHSFRHRGSPLLADGKLYLMSEDGVVTVVQTGRTFKVLATNDLDERCAASLAVADRTLYMRTHKALYAIRKP